MYQSDGRWRRQALVYFGEPQDPVIYRIDTLGIQTCRINASMASGCRPPHAIDASYALKPSQNTYTNTNRTLTHTSTPD